MWVGLCASAGFEDVCKSSGHRIVEQKLGWCSSVSMAVRPTRLDVS